MKKRELKKQEYSEGEILVANGNYLDLSKDGKEYKIEKEEILFGEKTYILIDMETGKKVAGGTWNFKPFELDINFIKKIEIL